MPIRKICPNCGKPYTPITNPDAGQVPHVCAGEMYPAGGNVVKESKG